MATFTWKAPGTSSDWNSGANWTLTSGSGTAPPGSTSPSTDVAILPGQNNASYTVTITVGGHFDIATLQSNGVQNGPTTLSILGSLLTNTISYNSNKNDSDDTTINIGAGGSLDIRTSITDANNVPENINIAGTGTGGHLLLGSASKSGIGVSNSNVTFDFQDAASGPSTGVIEWQGVPTTPTPTTPQTIKDAAWGDSFVFDAPAGSGTSFNFTGDKFTYTSTTLTVKDPTNTTTVLTMDNLSGTATAPLTGSSFLGVGNAIEIVCYARGTMLRTPDGEQPVEKLQAGEQVIALIDGREVAKTVSWLGHRRLDIVGRPRPETVAPVRIRRDAFADGMPHRDLIVSPDHAVFIDGKLICARQLVNGSTIRQELNWTTVDYYHVKLEEHAILLAEGLPAESYLDTGNSGFFENSDAPLVLHPDLTDETDNPTREAGSCAPFVWDEASVRPVWQRLVDRATDICLPVPPCTTTTNADLRLIANQRSVKPVHDESNLAIFVLPRGATEVRLLSRAQPPTEARPWLEDRRKLGIRVKRIVLRGANELREVPMDHPDLVEGWWDIEHDGQMMSRWTDGDAAVPLPAMEGPVMLELHLAGEMIYAVEPKPKIRTDHLMVA